ncbi:MAG: hypothetical protein WA234_10700, partial [Rectinemataceae bacterium]
IQLLTKKSRLYITCYTYGTHVAGSRHYYFLHYSFHGEDEGRIDCLSHSDKKAVLPSGRAAFFYRKGAER